MPDDDDDAALYATRVDATRRDVRDAAGGAVGRGGAG